MGPDKYFKTGMFPRPRRPGGKNLVAGLEDGATISSRNGRHFPSALVRGGHSSDTDRKPTERDVEVAVGGLSGLHIDDPV